MRRANAHEAEDRSPGRLRTLLTVAASFLAGVALTIPVMLIIDGNPSTSPQGSVDTTVPEVSPTNTQLAPTTTTAADATNQQNPTVEQTDLNASETSFGTLRWTRISGDVDTVPGSRIRQSSDGLYTAIEGNRPWQSEDGLSWTYGPPLVGLEDVRNVGIEDEWATEWVIDSGTSGEPAMTRLFARDDTGWRNVDLPLPSLPDINGIVWSIGVAIPIERNGTTVAQVWAHGEIPWGDHYGVSDMPCGTDTCQRGPHGWMEQDNVWTLVPASGGSPMATVAMTVTADAIEFHDTETEERVHVIEATESRSAQQIADALANGSMRVSGVFVQDGDGPFVFHETPFEVQFNNVFAVSDGGFAALEIQEQSFGSIDARVWTSDDAIVWSDRGAPSFLEGGGEWIHVETEADDVVARVILDSGSAGGEEIYESFHTTNGVDWTSAEPSQFPLFTRFHDASFGEVAIAMPQSSNQIWVSIDGDDWEEVVGPPGPHLPDGGGMSDAGATGDILWVLVVEHSGPRTLWIGTFDG